MYNDSNNLNSCRNQNTPLLNAFTVSEVNTLVSDVLIANLPNILSVEGEISNLSMAGSGHRYFSLKDAHSTISCALFRGAANRISHDVLSKLKNGDKVVVKANLNVYPPRGSYQLIVSGVELAGFGALAKAFAALKQKLDSAGYTAIEKKRPIPEWAQSIAVVTSSTGAAVRDVLTTLKRRAPFISVTVYPTLVQGQSAAENIVQALYDANNDKTASVILLVRGGGSLEDLQAFNDERVAMAVVNSSLPIVSGVGHETDFTIVDFVSDARAPTPTAAAEWISPDKKMLKQALDKQKRRLLLGAETAIVQKKRYLETFINRLSVQHPQAGLQQRSQRLDEINLRLTRIIRQKINRYNERFQYHCRQLLASGPQQKLSRAREQLNVIDNALSRLVRLRRQNELQHLQSYDQRLQHYSNSVEQYQKQLKGLEARLALLSPLGVLARGYALAFDAQGHLLCDTVGLEQGDELTIRLANGELRAKVASMSKT